MSIFKYYASLRSDILEIITGVENSGWSLFWDSTTPNWATKSKLEKLYKKYLRDAGKYGLIVVTRHSDCPNQKHSGDLISNAYGLEIEYLDSRYTWGSEPIYLGERYCICPCSSKNKPSEHWVIDNIIYKKESDQDLCSKLEDILCDVYEAIESAGDKKPRSAIRESLLRAILRINDQLLPESMDSYIKTKIETNA